MSKTAMTVLVVALVGVGGLITYKLLTRTSPEFGPGAETERGEQRADSPGPNYITTAKTAVETAEKVIAISKDVSSWFS